MLGTDIPYINHIGNVVMEAMTTIARENSPHPTIENPDLFVQCAILHDVIEDTEISYTVIAEKFGLAVAEGVLALTKNKTLASKLEQMRDSIGRIQQQPKEIWMVKLADRITNLQAPPKQWSQEKVKTYRDEAILILEELGDANPYLAERLGWKITQYMPTP